MSVCDANWSHSSAYFFLCFPFTLSLRSDGVPFAGDSLERSYLFYDRPSRLSSNAPACRGQSRLSGFCCAHQLCVRSPCQHISRMRTFDNNSCAISITSPRSLFRPRTQHGRWGHREKSRRASTRWDCRGKSCLAGLSPLSGTPSERRVNHLIVWRVTSLNGLYPFWSIWDIWDFSCWTIKKIVRKFVILLIRTSKIYLYI